MAQFMKAPEGLGGWILGAVILGPAAMLIAAGSLETALKDGNYLLGLAGLVASGLVLLFLLVTLMLSMRYRALWDWHLRTGMYPGDGWSNGGFLKGFVIGGGAMTALAFVAYQLMDEQNKAMFLIVWAGPALLAIGLIALFCGVVSRRWRGTRIPTEDEYRLTDPTYRKR